MDVRCDKCETVYEFDEAKVRPGGVTVKCASCGHMFKIRRRSTTNVGAPAVVAAIADASGPLAPPRPAGQQPPAADASEKVWMIRLDNGEVKTCRELSTLQQWIVAGLVTRSASISRNGKTWKRLGDIGELGSFFTVADEARAARATGLGAADPTVNAKVPRANSGSGPIRTRPKTQPPPPPGSVSKMMPARHEPPSDDEVTVEMDAEEARKLARAAADDSTPVVPVSRNGNAIAPPRAASAPAPAKAMRPPTPAAAPPGPPPAAPPAPAAAPARAAVNPAEVAAAAAATNQGPTSKSEGGPAPVADRSTGSWAVAGGAQLRKPPGMENAGPSGPTGGLARGIPTDDVAFAGGKKVGGGMAATQQDDDFGASSSEDLGDYPEARSSGVGKWIVLGAVAVLGISGAALYFGVLKKKSGEPVAALAQDAGTLDAGSLAVAPAGSDAGTPAPSAAPTDDTQLKVQAALGLDAETELQASALALATKDDAASLVARARIDLALAQHEFDRASVAADAKAKAELERPANARVLEALTTVRRALKSAADDPAGQLAMGQILFLQGKPSKEIERYLAKASAPTLARDVELLRAQIELRDRKPRQGRARLEKLAGDGAAATDVRAAFRLALLEVQETATDAATKWLDAVIAASPKHEGASWLRDQLNAAAVVEGDPLPPETVTAIDAGTSGSTGSSSGGSADTYDSLLTKGDKRAESGDCVGAMSYYEKALDINPTGVSALTGMGYCHIDRSQFASAHAKFKAALAISPRYQEALWGIAEAYQQQGRGDLAVGAYQKYLDEHPNGTRAAMARKQLENLGGGAPKDGAGGGSGAQPGGGAPAPGGAEPAPSPGGGAEPAPAPKPAPAPAPKPAPAGGGADDSSSDTPVSP